jgi:hypothetical protein
MEKSSAIEIEKQENDIEVLEKFLNNYRDKFKPELENEKPLKPREIELLIDNNIKEAAQYYSIFANLNLVKKPVDLLPEDISYFVNLRMPDLFWNSNKLFEQDLKILEICAQNFKNCCTHSGGCSFFEDFTHIHKEKFAQYVWLEADRVFSTEELDNLAKEYLTIKHNAVCTPPFVNSKENHALETIYRADTNIEPNEKGFIEYDKKTYLRKLFFNGKFLDIPKDWVILPKIKCLQK